MRKKFIFFYLLFISVLSFAVAQPKTIDLSQIPDHPRILLLEGEESMLKKHISSAKIWENVHQTIISFSDSIMYVAPVERVKTGKRLLSISRECLRRVFYLSYSWRMTNDRKYLDRAEKEMLAAAAFEDWNPSHYLDVGEMTMALGLGYDWLYHELPDSSKELIKKAIIEKGLKTSVGYNWGWLTSISNWNQVCNAGMFYGAMAVYDETDDFAGWIINRSVQRVTFPMVAYGPDGAYNEGYGYWGYGTTFNVLLTSAVDKIDNRCFSVGDYSGFFKTPYYLLHMLGYTGESFNYSDNIPSADLNPAMFWFARKLNDPSLLWNERHLLGEKYKNYHKLLPILLVWSAGIDMKSIGSPGEKMWAGQGKNPVALMRTSWDNPEAIYAGMKGGSCTIYGHTHMDIGSFVMESDGVRWAMDFGPQNYTSLELRGINLWNRQQDSERWNVFRYNSLAHNVISINNEFQRVDGYSPMISFSKDESFMNAVFDLSDAYKGQLLNEKRGLAIVNQQYVVVRDEVETSEKVTIRWNLVTPAKVIITGKSTAELTKDGKKLIIQVTEPSKVVMKTWSTVSPNDYDAPNPGTAMVGFEAVIPANSKAAINVLMIPEKAKGKTGKKTGALQTWPDDGVITEVYKP